MFGPTVTNQTICLAAAKQFNTDLAPRKSAIKLMIQDELTKLAEEADDEDEEEEEDAGKNEASLQTKMCSLDT